MYKQQFPRILLYIRALCAFVLPMGIAYGMERTDSKKQEVPQRRSALSEALAASFNRAREIPRTPVQSHPLEERPHTPPSQAQCVHDATITLACPREIQVIELEKLKTQGIFTGVTVSASPRLSGLLLHGPSSAVRFAYEYIIRNY